MTGEDAMKTPSVSIAPEHEGTITTNESGRAVLTFVRHLDHHIERVWAGLTQPDQITKWLAYRATIELEVGGRYELWLGGSDAEAPVAGGTITEVEPERVLQSEMNDGSVLRFELAPRGENCTLTFTDTRPEGERGSNSVLSGWHIRMDQVGPALDGDVMDWLALNADRDEHGFIRAIADIYWHYRNQTRE